MGTSRATVAHTPRSGGSNGLGGVASTTGRRWQARRGPMRRYRRPAMAGARETVIEHPNRDTGAARTMRVVVIALLVVTATLVAVVTVGGWDALESAKGLQIVFIVIDLLLAALVWRWRRGVLPVAAALAVVLGIFAGVAAPA